jgi:hypothetical protein
MESRVTRVDINAFVLRNEAVNKNTFGSFSGDTLIINYLEKLNFPMILWCPRPDLNRHASVTQLRILSPVRLPISPLGHKFIEEAKSPDIQNLSINF